MYGTVARLRLKPGMMGKLREFAAYEDGIKIPGHTGTIVYQLDSDANDVIMVILFENKDAYAKNAESPEQDARYQRFVALLDGAPEWNDGEIVYSHIG